MKLCLRSFPTLPSIYNLRTHEDFALATEKVAGLYAFGRITFEISSIRIAKSVIARMQANILNQRAGLALWMYSGVNIARSLT